MSKSKKRKCKDYYFKLEIRLPSWFVWGALVLSGMLLLLSLILLLF